MTWFLGQLACSVGKSQHVLFGLDMMHSVAVLRDDPALYRQLIQYTGAYDIFDVLAKLPHTRNNDDRQCSDA
jgi:hypothetical protein